MPDKTGSAEFFYALVFCCCKQVAEGVYPDGEIKYKCASRGYTAWWQRKTYFTFLTAYILVVPAVIITFCYVSVVRVVWKSGKDEVQTSGNCVYVRCLSVRLSVCVFV